jgi:hypothetical protein
VLARGRQAALQAGAGPFEGTLIESRHRAPLVPLRLFRSRPLVGANLVMLIFGTVAFGMPFILTLYAQRVLSYSAVKFGLGTAVLAVMAAGGSIVAKRSCSGSASVRSRPLGCR